MERYDRPEIEIVEVAVEDGFGGSFGGSIEATEEMDGGGSVNVNW